MIFVLLVVVLAALQNAQGDFMGHGNEEPSSFVGDAHVGYQGSDVVGSAAARAHLHALAARARARAIADRAKFRVRHPLVVMEQTPEEFLHRDAPVLEPRPTLKKRFYEPEPIVGSPNFDQDPIVGSAPYELNAPYEHNDDTMLSILPGQWRDHPYQEEYYDSYQVTPMSYVIPENYENYYRNADPHKKKKKKKKIVAREEEDEEDNGERHFHGHKAHKNPHGFMYHGNPPLHEANRDHPLLFENQGGVHQSMYQPNLHESFSSNADIHTFPSQGHQITTNKQKTFIVLPPNGGNFQISQVSGNQNAVSQSQASKHNLHTQTSQIIGNNNAVSQSQARLANNAPDPVVGAPNIINVGRRRKIWSIPGPDEADISVVIKRSVPNELNRKKRTIQLARLLLDPNAQIDVPKTLENAGTAFRNSFENKHAPVHHLRNAMGSAKDAFMSTLKIPPQDLFIPSKYQIVEKDSEENEIAKESPATFNKMGTMFRESVQSGQDALTHMGDVIHSSRKALLTSGTVAPRMLVSSLRVPAVQHPLVSRFKNDDADGFRRQEDTTSNFIGVPQVMDALGLSNPNRASEENYYIFSDVDDVKVHETLNVLNDAVKAMGVKTLKDFFSKVKARQAKLMCNLKKAKNEDFYVDVTNDEDSNVANELLDDGTYLAQLFNTTKEGQEQNSSENGTEEIEADNPKMIKRMLGSSSESEYGDIEHGEYEESVGIGMTMGSKMLTPFMGKLERKEHPYPYYDYEDDYEYRK